MHICCIAVQHCTISEGYLLELTKHLSTQLLETAAGKASGDVGKQFDAAVANNLTTVRMFGFGTMGGFALQSSIGSYNEQAFQAFDKVSAPHKTLGTGMQISPNSLLQCGAVTKLDLMCVGAFRRSLIWQQRGSFGW